MCGVTCGRLLCMFCIFLVVRTLCVFELTLFSLDVWASSSGSTSRFLPFVPLSTPWDWFYGSAGPWARPVQSWLHTVRAAEGLQPTIWSWLRLHFGGTSSCVANLDGDFFEVPLAFVEREVDVSHRSDGVMGVSKMKGVTNFTGSAWERGWWCLSVACPTERGAGWKNSVWHFAS